ncbi:MAG TPA: SUMF1/EgtB/PvdO family nonheme iron enzyme [Acidobacteriaceae bacterium]|nr:SUMF1/EgtB/PvdO family nonheme iron enzyme [Acidobacteriaceae bacterium]
MNQFARRWPILFVAALLLCCSAAVAQDTAYPPKDAQIPGPASPADSQAWLADLQHWRTERLARVGYNGANYSRPEFNWTQHNFVCVQMMVEERNFYDPERGVYTVDKYLDALKKEFGGVDSVLIWDTYPDLGVDNRNQFDRLRDLPGGIAGVKKMVADFHRRGVKVLFPETPWDMGTRQEGAPDWTAQAKLMAEVGADGLLGDTMDGLPHAFLAASEKAGNPLVLQPEGLPSDEALAWNEMSWGYWSYPFVPETSIYKWLEHRHMPVLVTLGRHHMDEFQAGFFNGVGFADQEDTIGIHNGIAPRELEALRRVVAIERANAALLVSPQWEPYAPTLKYGIFASKFPGNGQVLWTIINRNPYDVNGRQMTVPFESGMRYFDLWRGVELTPQISSSGPRTATLSFPMAALGFGAVLAVHGQSLPQSLEPLLAQMRVLSAKPLSDFSDEWTVLPQHMIDIPATEPATTAPAGMVLIPGGKFDFKVRGVSVAGGNEPGVDVQYPWEDSPRRFHDHVLNIKPFYIDRYPVTNAQFKAFLDATHYHPRDGHNFLRDWKNGSYPTGWAQKPVTWVSLEDARAYAHWAGKRLPNEWEWQYAAQGTDGRTYPWGNQWDPSAVPVPDKGHEMRGPDDVHAHPRGASPFGVMDMVGNVWQWTSAFEDPHTRTATLRGGSYYQPQGSMWYFPQAYRLDEHGKYLLMAPSLDRSGAIGFRCAKDAAP